jgi:hypothetical protein
MDSMPFLLLPELFTDADGRAKFRDIKMDLSEGSPAARLSPLAQGSGHQFRMSPVGFRSAFHCTTTPQWLIVLQGAMEIGLQDGSSRIFKAGQGFYSNDILPVAAVFDAKLHGHWSAQAGDEPLVTVFIRAGSQSEP